MNYNYFKQQMIKKFEQIVINGDEGFGQLFFILDTHKGIVPVMFSGDGEVDTEDQKDMRSEAIKKLCKKPFVRGIANISEVWVSKKGIDEESTEAYEDLFEGKIRVSELPENQRFDAYSLVLSCPNEEVQSIYYMKDGEIIKEMELKEINGVGRFLNFFDNNNNKIRKIAQDRYDINGDWDLHVLNFIQECSKKTSLAYISFVCYKRPNSNIMFFDILPEYSKSSTDTDIYLNDESLEKVTWVKTYFTKDGNTNKNYWLITLYKYSSDRENTISDTYKIDEKSEDLIPLFLNIELNDDKDRNEE